MRPIAHFLLGLHVVAGDMNAINDTKFIIVDCLQQKIFEAEQVYRAIVFSTTSFLNLWPHSVAPYKTVHLSRHILPARGSDAQ